MTELHILDLNNILCVGTYAGRSMNYATNNIPTGGIYQVLQRIKKINPFDNPDKKIVIVTDHKVNFRKQKYENYKAQRGKYDDANKVTQRKGIRLQEELLLNTLSQVGIPIFTKEGYEADDLMINILYNFVVQEGNPLYNDTTAYLHTSDGDWIGAMALSPNNIFYQCTTTTSDLSKVVTYSDFTKVKDRYPEYEYYHRMLYGDKSDNYAGIVSTLGDSILNPINEDITNMLKSYHISTFCWSMDWWKEYMVGYSGGDANRISTILENVELSFPYYMEDIITKDLSKVSNYKPDWSKLYEFVDLFSIKVLEKHLGPIRPFSDEKVQVLSKIKNKFKAEYNDVFELYTGLIKESTEPAISTEEVDRIYNHVMQRIPTISI